MVTTTVSWLQGAFGAAGSHSSTVIHGPFTAAGVQAVEASAAGDPAGDEKPDAVAKETLRIRPVVSDVGRILTEPVELAGNRLPVAPCSTPAVISYFWVRKNQPDNVINTVVPLLVGALLYVVWTLWDNRAFAAGYAVLWLQWVASTPRGRNDL